MFKNKNENCLTCKEGNFMSCKKDNNLCIFSQKHILYEYKNLYLLG